MRILQLLLKPMLLFGIVAGVGVFMLTLTYFLYFAPSIQKFFATQGLRVFIIGCIGMFISWMPVRMKILGLFSKNK